MDIERLKHELIDYSRKIDISNQKGNIELGLFQVFYNKVSKINNSSELNSILDEIIIMHKDYLKQYDELYVEYQKLSKIRANSATLNRLANKLNSYAYSASALKNIASIISKYVKRRIVTETSKKKEGNINKFISTNEVVKPNVTRVNNQSRNNIINTFNSNENTKYFLDCSRLIIKNQRKLMESKSNDKEALKNISKAIIERRNFISNLYGNSDIYHDMYNRLMILERIENDVYSDFSEYEYPFTINSEEDFYDKLEESFKNISELIFSQNKNTFKIISQNSYHHNLIASLFNTNDNTNKEYREALELSDDIIHLMSAYNIYEEEKDFINNNSKNNIATQKVTKDSIHNAKDTMDLKKRLLYKLIKNRFKLINKPIEVVDYNKPLAIKEKMLYIEYFNYCEDILKNSKNMSL